MKQFKYVSANDINGFLRDMRSNKLKTNWISSVVLESEEQNKYIDIFATKLKDKRNDLLFIKELKEEVERLKGLEVKSIYYVYSSLFVYV